MLQTTFLENHFSLIPKYRDDELYQELYVIFSLILCLSICVSKENRKKRKMHIQKLQIHINTNDDKKNK